LRKFFPLYKGGLGGISGARVWKIPLNLLILTLKEDPPKSPFIRGTLRKFSSLYKGDFESLLPPL
jgi:hypothetical protein